MSIFSSKGAEAQGARVLIFRSFPCSLGCMGASSSTRTIEFTADRCLLSRPWLFGRTNNWHAVLQGYQRKQEQGHGRHGQAVSTDDPTWATNPGSFLFRRFYEHIKARRVDPSYQSVNVSLPKPSLCPETEPKTPLEPDTRLLRQVSLQP